MATTSSETAPDDEPLALLVVRREDSGPALRAACEAFDQLYQRHARTLVAFLAARVRRGELEDLNQEVWRRAWHHLPEQFRGGNFRAWLHQIARNALIDQGRKKQAEPLEGREERPDSRDEPPVERLIERERRDALKRCLDRLGTEAAALVKGRLGGEDYAEICARLGIRPERAHKLWHTVKARLRSCVEQDLA